MENSFDVEDNQITVDKTSNEKKIKLSKKLNKPITNVKVNIAKENLISNKDKLNQTSTKSIKKVTFSPQPYRIILKLSAANPSAPAESVTKALIKAGVQFEVEKIERFDEESLLKNTSFKR